MDRTTCPNCGAPTTGGDRFCQNCGHALGSSTAPSRPEPAPVPPYAPAPGLPPSPAARPHGAEPRWPVAPAPAPTPGASADAPAGVQPLLEFDVAYPERLSRLLIFVKWLLVIPHLIVLTFLLIGVYVVTFVAWFAILFTGRYPRGMWEFTLKTMRWMANVSAYYYLQRDEYPPFSGTAAYPVQFQMDYPARMSRLLIFVKWLLLIPHFVVLYILGILVSIVIFIAWFAILFVGRMPRGMHDFVTGYHRWSLRILTYGLLLTDAYPPFTTAHVPSPTRSPGRTPLPY